MAHKLTIYVRSRVKRYGKWVTEWMEQRHSWRGAWRVVANCGLEQKDCHVWSLPDDDGHFYVDIGGNAEDAERRAEVERLLNL